MSSKLLTPSSLPSPDTVIKLDMPSWYIAGDATVLSTEVLSRRSITDRVNGGKTKLYTFHSTLNWCRHVYEHNLHQLTPYAFIRWGRYRRPCQRIAAVGKNYHSGSSVSSKVTCGGGFKDNSITGFSLIWLIVCLYCAFGVLKKVIMEPVKKATFCSKKVNSHPLHFFHC